jgi:SAM-dependent methyltransferase
MFHDFARGCWRALCALRGLDASDLLRSPALLRQFAHDWRSFRKLGGNAPFGEIAPQLFDRSSDTQSGGGHYFYQDVWALRKLRRFQPTEHHDVGSRLDGFVAQATAICPVFYWDIRAPQFRLPDFHFRPGSIVSLPVPDASITSLSCLHVAEHIGLGRYGDPIDPYGTEKALQELQRILATGGQLLYSMPIGRERVEFNAQRIWSPWRSIETLSELRLVEFSVVTDSNEFLADASPKDFTNARYACGLYRFQRNP